MPPLKLEKALSGHCHQIPYDTLTVGRLVVQAFLDLAQRFAFDLADTLAR